MASEIKVDTISEKTSANGVTIDGVSLKDSKIATANSVDSDAYVDGSIETAHIDALQVTGAKLNTDVISAQTELAAEPADTDEFMVSDGGVLKRIDYSLIKAANTPAFSAYLGSAQTPSESTYTKVSIDTEYYDTDSAFDKDTNYRFTVPSGGDGNYFFYGKVEYTAVTANSRLMAVFYLNGAAVNQGRAQTSPGGTTDNYAQVSWSVDLSESDYVELWTYYDGEGGTRTYETPKSTFTGFKLIT